jgi:hypothetical protein
MSFTSEIVKNNSIPDFIKRDNNSFVSFIVAYYDWLSTQKSTLDIADNFLNYTSVDNTLPEFVEHFIKHYAVKFPSTTVVDYKKIIPLLKEFYENKGNEQSYKFLFRILFDDDIEFYYPKTDILIASDGKWQQQKSIKIKYTGSYDYLIFSGQTLVGVTSGAKAMIENVLFYLERGIPSLELFLSSISGSFIANEKIKITYYNSNNQEVFIEEDLLSVYTDVTITNGGSGYSVGSNIVIRDASSSAIGFANVDTVTSGPITGLTVDDDGVGYRGDQREVNYFFNLPINYVWNGSNLLDQPITGGVFDFLNEQISFEIDTEILDDEAEFITFEDDENSLGNGASGYISLVDDFGGIKEVTLVSGGELYINPVANILTVNGTGGDIGVLGGGGVITKATVSKFPISLPTDNNGDVTLDFTNSGDGNATGTISKTTIAKYQGTFINEDGFLSSNKRLQDNFYYQQYSYVLKVSKDITQWGDVVSNVIHPAGMKFFGDVVFRSEMTLEHDVLAFNVLETSTTYTSINVSYGNSKIRLEDIANDFSPYYNLTILDDFDTTWTSAGNLVLWDKDVSSGNVERKTEINKSFLINESDTHFIAGKTPHTKNGSNEILTIADRFNKNYNITPLRAVYNTSSFSGRKSIDSFGISFLTTSSFAPSVEGFGYLVVEFPATIPQRQWVFGFGDTTSSNIRSGFFIETNGNLTFDKKEDDTSQIISGIDNRSSKVIILFNKISSDSVSFYITNASAVTFNPHSIWDLASSISLFNRNDTDTTSINGIKIAEIFYKNKKHSIDDPSIASIITSLKLEYGIA